MHSTQRRSTRRCAAAGLLALATALALAAPAAAGQPRHTVSSPGANAVLAWNEITMNTLVSGAIPVPEQPLYLAYVHRAVYAAVSQTEIRGGDDAAAVTAAAHRVLRAYFPAQQTALDDDYDTAIAARPDTLARRVGITIGRYAARALLASRRHDGRNGPALETPSPAPGVWIPTPPNTVGVSSWLGNVDPFVLASSDEFRAPPPPALTSSAWARAYNEVLTYGSTSSTVRTPEQTEAARFWADPPYVQNQRAVRAVVAERNLTTIQTARVFAEVDSAAADALIACWDTKYHYWFWRPFSAIPAGDTDGNPATVADPAWTPLLGTPNHPEYASAHGCATSALFIVLSRLLNHSDVLDIDLSSTLTGTTHHFATVADLLREVADARVWGGLHWRFSTTAGVQLGRSVARAVLAAHGNLG